MKVILAAVLSMLLLASAPLASEPPIDPRAFARGAGLPDDFELVYEESKEPYAYYTAGGLACIVYFCMEVPPHIYVSAPASWPSQYVLFLLAHEVAHFHQDRLGLWSDEWAADEFAVRHLCSLGMNGPEIGAGALAAVTHLSNLDSFTHGNHFRRMDNARSMRCGDLLPHGQQA